MSKTGFDIATKQLTLSPELVEKLPKNVRSWQPNHVIAWLEEIFAGTADLSKYRTAFHSLGVNGVDLLTADDTQLNEFGITSPLHVARAKTSIGQLVVYQQAFDNNYDEAMEKEKEEQTFVLLEKEFNALPKPHKPPKNMKLWKPIDIFDFMKKNEDLLSMFIKPLAMTKINGEEFIALAHSNEPLSLHGLEATPRDVARLKTTIKTAKARMEKLEKRVREEKRNAIYKQLSGITHPLRQGRLLGQGAFGKVYLADYNKSNVALKELTTKMPKKTATNTATTEEDAKELAKKQEKEEKDYKQNVKSDLLYEATMTQLATGSGVVKLIAVDVQVDPPRMITEYMCRRSVEVEYQMFTKHNSEDSIFHPCHHRNVIEQNENSVEDPVLLQKVRIARDVASALARIHQLGIIHLDIAARNIFLDAAHRPKIGDFGLATIEQDMLEQYEFRKQKLEKYSSDGDTTDEIKHVFQIDVEDEALFDPDAIRKFNSHTQKERPVRFMPEWVVNCGSPPNPKLDRHVDVYSFGCFMLELASFAPPHPNASIEEVIRMKQMGQGDPEVPPDVDPEYAMSMTMCWEKPEAQPSMQETAKELAKLHHTLATQSFSEVDDYTTLKDFVSMADRGGSEYTDVYSQYSSIGDVLGSQYSSVTANTATNDITSGSYASISSGATSSDGYSSVSDTARNVSRPLSTTAAPPKNAPAGMMSIPVALDRVRLQIPDTMQVSQSNVELLQEYEDVGISREKLSTALNCAKDLRDHKTLALYLECIKMENNSQQVDAILMCFDHLEKLANDIHGYTHDDNVWPQLCALALRVADSATQYRERVSNTSQTVGAAKTKSVLLDKSLEAPILRCVLSTLAALLKDKDIKSTLNSLELSALLFYALDNFRDDKMMVESAAKAITSLAPAAASMRDELYNGGAIGYLLDAMRLRSDENSLQLHCIRALTVFPAILLINPRPVKSHSGTAEASPTSEITFTPVGVAAMWGEVLSTLMGVVSRASVEAASHMPQVQTANVNEDVTALSLVEQSLLMLYRSCESAIATPEVIQCFLYTTTQNDVRLLTNIVKTNPDHFRIQEGAIGLLGHMMSTGNADYSATVPRKELEDSNRAKPLDMRVAVASSTEENGKVDEVEVVVAERSTPTEDRLTVLLELDPTLSLLLRAMDKFRVSDNITSGIKLGSATKAGATSSVLNKHGIYGPTASRVDGTAAGMTMASSTVDFKKNLEMAFDAGFNEGLLELSELLVDQEGEIVSAASLQKSAAVVIGVACSFRRDVQVNLLNTPYNELILRAFKNFSDNVGLLQFGCHALFSTCRGNAKHQRMLMELNVLKYLMAAFYAHESVWEVTSAIICAIIGLIEPPTEMVDAPSLVESTAGRSLSVSSMSASTKSKANSIGTTAALSENEAKSVVIEMKRALAKRKRAADGYRIVVGICTVGNFSEFSLVEQLAKKVANFQIGPETHPLAANFLKLLATIAFWNPWVLFRWGMQFVNLGAFEHFPQDVILKWAKEIGRNMGRRQWFEKHSSALNPNVLEMSAQDKVMVGMGADPADPESEGAEVVRKQPLASAATIEKSATTTSATANNLARSQLGEQSIEETIKDISKNCTLMQFISLSMKYHTEQPHVICAGLALMCKMMMQAMDIYIQDETKPHQIGSELPYLTEKEWELYVAEGFSSKDEGKLTGEQLIAKVKYLQRAYISTLRFHAIRERMLHYCLAVVRSTEDNPILIRYSLWMLLLFISQSRNDGGGFVSINAATIETGAQAAAEMAVHGAFEWAIDVLRKYDDFYSLQCLAVLFLVWMEHHGRFENRPKKDLRELKQLLMNAKERDLGFYRTLDDEGYDALLLGQSLHVFGNIRIHADQLLRLVESHLPEDIAAGASVSKSATATGETDVVAATGKPPWDHRTLPYEVTLTSYELEEEPITQKNIVVYSINVQWNLEVSWRITRKFSQFWALKKHIDEDFANFNSVYTTVMKKDNFSLIRKNRSPKFLEGRRKDMQGWLDQVTSLRATRYNEHLMTFLEVQKHAPIETVRRIYPQATPHQCTDIPRAHTFPVNSMHYDPFSALLFLGVGTPTVGIFGGSGANVGGAVCVYQVPGGGTGGQCDLPAAIQLKCQEKFNVGVVSVIFEPCRRWLFVGLASGAIVYYYLNEAADKFEYCSELDSHRKGISGMLVDVGANAFIASSVSGMISKCNLDDGLISAQGAIVGSTFTCVAYDRDEEMVFVGTVAGRVAIMDFAANPPVDVHKLNMTHQTKPERVSKNPVVALQFNQESRILYAAHMNNIHVFKIKGRANICKVTEAWTVFSMAERITVADLLLVQPAGFLVIAGSGGIVTVYDVSERKQVDKTTDAATAALSKMGLAGSAVAKADAALSTTSSALLPWNEIIKCSNASMRDWLRAKGVTDALTTLGRSSLVGLITRYSNIHCSDVMEICRPPVSWNDTLLTWNFHLEKGTDFVSMCLLDDFGTIVLGTNKGNVRFLCLAEFLDAFGSFERRDIDSVRSAIKSTFPSNSELVKGSTKTTRGKRHIVGK